MLTSVPCAWGVNAAMCAALPACRRVISEGRVEEVLMWLRQLEEDAGVAPIWEVLFQAMCCPVPQASRLARPLFGLAHTRALVSLGSHMEVLLIPTSLFLRAPGGPLAAGMPGRVAKV